VLEPKGGGGEGARAAGRSGGWGGVGGEGEGARPPAGAQGGGGLEGGGGRAPGRPARWFPARSPPGPAGRLNGRVPLPTTPAARARLPPLSGPGATEAPERPRSGAGAVRSILNGPLLIG
jgi:hypothetical protein